MESESELHRMYRRFQTGIQRAGLNEKRNKEKLESQNSKLFRIQLSPLK